MLALGKWRSNIGAESRSSCPGGTGVSNAKPGPRGSSIQERTRQNLTMDYRTLVLGTEILIK